MAKHNFCFSAEQEGRVFFVCSKCESQANLVLGAAEDPQPTKVAGVWTWPVDDRDRSIGCGVE